MKGLFKSRLNSENHKLNGNYILIRKIESEKKIDEKLGQRIFIFQFHKEFHCSSKNKSFTIKLKKIFIKIFYGLYCTNKNGVCY